MKPRRLSSCAFGNGIIGGSRFLENGHFVKRVDEESESFPAQESSRRVGAPVPVACQRSAPEPDDSVVTTTIPGSCERSSALQRRQTQPTGRLALQGLGVTVTQVHTGAWPSKERRAQSAESVFAAVYRSIQSTDT